MRVINKDGAKEEFQDNKLYDSVYYPAREAELEEHDASDLADKVVYEIKAWISEHEDNVFSTREIREKVIDILERESEDTCFLYKTHMDLN
jgi:transcriptional regulator NrdR family protein